MWSTLNNLMTSRSRLLAKIERSFATWGRAMSEAQAVDEVLRTHNNISNGQVQWYLYWTMIPITALMDLCMSLMVELDLLAENEIDCFYWYWDYICSTRVYAFNSIRELKAAMDRELHRAKVEIANKTIQRVTAMKKMRRKKDAALRDAAEEAEALKVLQRTVPDAISVSSEEMMVRAKSQLCRGVMRLYLVASKYKCPSLEKCAYPFGPSWPHRFMYRYRIFEAIPFPHLLTFEKFTDIIDTQVNSDSDIKEIVRQSGHFFRTCKAMIEDTKKHLSIVQANPPNLFELINPHDLLPIKNCTEFLKASVVGALTVHRLEEQLSKVLILGQDEANAASIVTKSQLIDSQDPSSLGVDSESIFTTGISASLKFNFSYHHHFAMPELTLITGRNCEDSDVLVAVKTGGS
jgi:hypothetical protein